MTVEHPCKDTCSGWGQGFDRGVLVGMARIADRIEKLELIAKAAADVIDVLGDEDNGPPQWIAKEFEALYTALKGELLTDEY